MNFSFLKNVSKWTWAGVSTALMTGIDLLFNRHEVTPVHAGLTTLFTAAMNYGAAAAVHAYQHPEQVKGLFNMFKRSAPADVAEEPIPAVRQRKRAPKNLVPEKPWF